MHTTTRARENIGNILSFNSHLRLLHTGELHLSRYQRAACSFTHSAVCTLGQMRGASCIRRLHGEIKGSGETRRSSKAPQTERERREKQVLSVPGLLTTTCMRPPVVSKIAHTKEPVPRRNYQLILKWSLEKWRLWIISTQSMQTCHSHGDSLAFATCDHKFRLKSKILPNSDGLNWVFSLARIKLGFSEGRNEIITKRPSS